MVIYQTFSQYVSGTYLNKRSGLPFLCLTKMPSRQDPRATSVPVLSYLDDEMRINSILGKRIQTISYPILF